VQSTLRDLSSAKEKLINSASLRSIFNRTVRKTFGIYSIKVLGRVRPNQIWHAAPGSAKEKSIFLLRFSGFFVPLSPQKELSS
jgi:hypothetical protein